LVGAVLYLDFCLNLDFFLYILSNERAREEAEEQSVENEQEKDDNVEPPSKEVPETTDKEETDADNLETDNTAQATVDGSKAEDAEKQSLEASLSTNSY
jgi:far upstream element-binding protein